MPKQYLLCSLVPCGYAVTRLSVKLLVSTDITVSSSSTLARGVARILEKGGGGGGGGGQR